MLTEDGEAGRATVRQKADLPLQDLLSADIQSAQFTDLLVRDLDDDNTKGKEMGDPSRPAEW